MPSDEEPVSHNPSSSSLRPANAASSDQDQEARSNCTLNWLSAVTDEITDPNKETEEPDYSRAPTLKVKLNYWEDEFKLELYNKDKQLVYPNGT